MRFLIALLALFAIVVADPMNYSDEPEVAENILYLNYVDVPDHVIKGEVFPVTIKVLSTIDQYEDITYSFANSHGVELFSEIPERKVEGDYYLDTFYYQAISKWVRIPDLSAAVRYSQFHQTGKTLLEGKEIRTVALNANGNFCRVLAESFQIDLYKTTHYDAKQNVVVFDATAMRANLQDFYLKDAIKQGMESLNLAPQRSTMTFYAIMPKSFETLRFDYFDLNTRKFETITIPIVVEEDMVSTQSDLKPTEYKHVIFKIATAVVISLIGLVMLLYRKRWIYLVVVVAPIVYIVYAAVPIRNVCIKANSPIYLLPMENGTIFERAKSDYILEVQGSIEGFTKVKLQNNKIGWIHDEDICTP